jgi:hypothetical protein
VSRIDDLKEIRRGAGIVFIGSGAFFGDLLKKYPDFATLGEVIAFWSSGLLMFGLGIVLVLLSLFIWRRVL